LSTSDEAGNPSARVLILKNVDKNGWQSSAEVDSALAAATEQLSDDPSMVAPGWTLYTVQADEIEFWQADPNRRHLRLQYRRTESGWTKTLLWP
jgi:pyridoxamine 5'-phosphate oxidase